MDGLKLAQDDLFYLCALQPKKGPPEAVKMMRAGLRLLSIEALPDGAVLTIHWQYPALAFLHFGEDDFSGHYQRFFVG